MSYMKQDLSNTQQPRHYRKPIKIGYLLFLFIIFTAFAASGKESSCVKCHTDEKMLKSLVVVPKLSEEAGGG
jgi:hypothetical protein